jgi:hypothetical protein
MLAAGCDVAGARPTIFAKVLLAWPFILDMLRMDAMQLLCVTEHV